MDIYEFRYKEDGVLLNDDVDPTVGFVDLTRIEGLSSSPFRVTERDREGQDGGFVDAEFEKSRTITIEGTVYCPYDTHEQYLELLKANFAPTEEPLPLFFQPPGTNERVVFCKSLGLQYDWGLERRIGITNVQMQLIAEDPRIYDSVPTVGNSMLSSSITGRAYNKAFNYGYGPAVLGGLVIIHNSGNRDTGAVITIYGPIDNPTVAHDVSGRELAFDISLQSDQFLEINLINRTVLLNGTASRRGNLNNLSRWFLLSPGDNSLRLIGSDPIGGTPDPSMTVETRGAYR